MRFLIFILTLALIVTSCKKEEEFVPSKNYTLKGRIYNSRGLIKNKSISFTYLRKVTGTGNYNEHFLGGAYIDANGYFEFTYPEQEVLNKYPDNYHIIIWQGSYEVVKYIPVHQDIEEEFSSIPIIDLDVTFINSKPESKNDTFRYAFYNSDYELSLISDSALAKDYPDSFTVNFSNSFILFTTRNGSNLKTINFKYSPRESGGSYDRYISYENRYIWADIFPEIFNLQSYKRYHNLKYNVYW